jgi:hypothetical protein
MNYFAIIGDINRSRALEDRAAVQRKLQATIAQMNKTIEPGPATPLKLTAGDEVQGLSEDPGYSLKVIVALSDAVSPEQFSWGLGCGPLSTDISDDVALVDGPCFHRAREALERSRKKRTWFQAEGFDPYFAAILTALMNLMGSIREDWTAKQTAYVLQARYLSQIEVARATGKSPSTVSRALRATKFERIVEAERAVRLLLENLHDV